MKKLLMSCTIACFLSVIISCKRNDDPAPLPLPVVEQGDVFYSDTDGDVFWLHDPEGVAEIRKVQDNGNKVIEDILVDPVAKKVYLADPTDDKIFVADLDKIPDIVFSEFVSTKDPVSLSMIEENGKRNIYMAADGELKKINSETKAITNLNFGQGPATVTAVVVDNGANKFYINQDDSGIRKLPDNIMSINQDLDAGKIDLDPNNDKMVYINSKTNQVIQSTKFGVDIKVLGFGGNPDSRSVSYDPSKNFIYYANPNNEGKLLRRDLTSNNIKQFNTTKIRAVAVVK